MRSLNGYLVCLIVAVTIAFTFTPPRTTLDVAAPSLRADRLQINGMVYLNQRVVAVGEPDSFYQDVDIGTHTIRVNNPVLAEGDGPVYQVREWYQPFFTDEASVAASMAPNRAFTPVDNR